MLHRTQLLRGLGKLNVKKQDLQHKSDTKGLDKLYPQIEAEITKLEEVRGARSCHSRTPTAHSPSSHASPRQAPASRSH